ncbi:MAG TPA: hypothetical protein VFT91_09490 [Dehalococcoidia bacterium]|nr:hypothetical protein [Dehalococcoidia bacterium]
MRAINQPVSWWGWHWEPPVPMSIVEIVAAGNMSSRLAALFWVAMERGASLIVAADPPGAGKTTTLTALMSLTPPETMVYFTRGIGEPFALPAVSPSHRTYLLVNEMSDHLPVYTWDHYARRAFELLSEGYSLATTMHADSVEGVLAQLEEELHVPRSQIARLTFIVPMEVRHEGAVRRRVREVAMLEPNGDDFAINRIARWDAASDGFEVFADGTEAEAFARWAGLPGEALAKEIDQRRAFLDGLHKAGTTSIPEVNAAVERFYGERRGRQAPRAQA